jgi:hypothetical protein
MISKGKQKKLSEIPVPVPLRGPRTSHEDTTDSTRGSKVRRQRLGVTQIH